MGYDSRKAQNHNLRATQYKFSCQNNRTTPNSLKNQKYTQNNDHIDSRIPNLKNTIFQRLGLLPGKIDGRALTSGKALTPILNA